MGPEDADQSRAAIPGKWELRADSRRPLPELIGDKLTEFIAAGVFKPGEQLPNEPELARRLGVARSSVRTALQRLEVQRIVQVRRGRGWFVRRSPAADVPAPFPGRQPKVSDLLEYRMALEGMAVSLAAVRASDGEVDDLLKLSTDHARIPRTDIDQLVRTDEEFHGALVRASHNDVLIASYFQLVPQLADFRRERFADRGAPQRSGTDHQTVVMFIKRGDSAGARAAMMAHLLHLYHAAVDAEPDGNHKPADLQISHLVDHEDEPEWPRRTHGTPRS